MEDIERSDWMLKNIYQMISDVVPALVVFYWLSRLGKIYLWGSFNGKVGLEILEGEVSMEYDTYSVYTDYLAYLLIPFRERLTLNISFSFSEIGIRLKLKQRDTGMWEIVNYEESSMHLMTIDNNMVSAVNNVFLFYSGCPACKRNSLCIPVGNKKFALVMK